MIEADPSIVDEVVVFVWDESEGIGRGIVGLFVSGAEGVDCVCFLCGVYELLEWGVGGTVHHFLH